MRQLKGRALNQDDFRLDAGLLMLVDGPGHLDLIVAIDKQPGTAPGVRLKRIDLRAFFMEDFPLMVFQVVRYSDRRVIRE